VVLELPGPVTDIINELPHAHPELEEHRKLSEITRIVVHEDAVWAPDGNYNVLYRLAQQARYHISGRNWNPNPSGPWIPGFGLMYHLRVTRKGKILVTQPFSLITWHASSWNREGLAICLDLGDGQAPSGDQLDGLKRCLDWICHRRPDIPAGTRDVYGHTEEPSTTKACPGLALPYVQQYRREGKW
jgi:hypothetical protein